MSDRIDAQFRQFPELAGNPCGIKAQHPLEAVKKASRVRLAALLVSGVVASAYPAMVQAQDNTSAQNSTKGGSSGDSAGADEIIVTATKRAQTLQDTPVAVTVTSAETLQRAQIRDVYDLTSVVPSLRIQNAAVANGAIFFIRGFGNGANAGIEPSVGVFVDGVYRSRAAAAISDFPDIERVEVLRGPQSTLFGKNASAGVISFVTREPQFTFGGSAELSYGNYDAKVVKASITGPLTDTIAFSLSGGLNKRDGYVKDLGSRERVNDRNRWFARGQLLFTPSDSAKIRIIADYDKLHELCCAAANVADGPTGNIVRALGGQVGTADPFSDIIYYNFAPENRIKNYGLSMQADFDIGPGKLTSITSYRRSIAVSNNDGDSTTVSILGALNLDTRIRTVTQELRYASDFGGPFEILFGGFYFNERVNYAENLEYGTDARPYFDALIRGATGNTVSASGLEALLGKPNGTYWAAGQGMSETFRLRDEAFSLFAQGDLRIAAGLTFTGGIAYTNDSKRLSGTGITTDVFSSTILPAPLSSLQALQYLRPFQNFPNAVEDGRFDGDKFTYLARLAYKINRGLNVYASYATGYKAASVNLGRDARPTADDRAALIATGAAVPNLIAGSRSAGPENSRVLEFGIKGQWERAGFNFALFDQSIKGFQSNIFLGTSFLLANAGKQSTFGFEMEGWIKPIDPLTITAAVTYLDPVYDSFVNSGVGDLSDKRPSGIPDFSTSLSVAYTHRLANGDAIVLRGDHHYESEVQMNDVVSGFDREINSFNGSLTYEAAGGLDFSIWGRNLTNDRYLTQAFPSPAQPGSVLGYPNQPRTYGVTARYRF